MAGRETVVAQRPTGDYGVILIRVHSGDTFCNGNRKCVFLIGPIQVVLPCFGMFASIFCLMNTTMDRYQGTSYLLQEAEAK